MSVPKLRFPAFTEEWERKNLGEIAAFSKGKGISKVDISEDGKTECIRYGELYTHYGEVIDEIKSRTNVSVRNLVLSKANDVIIPASGETQIDIATASCILKTGIGLGGDLNIIKTKNNGVFLSYYLNNRKKIDIANLAQGISVVHLYSSQLALLNLNIPTLTEQNRIATFLTDVNEKLTQLKKKKNLLEQYKKGIMQKIFDQKFRFKDNDNKEFPPWESKKLEDVCEKIQDGNYGGDYPKSTDFIANGIPFLTSKAIGQDGQLIEDKIDYISLLKHAQLSKAHLKINDILFTNRGSNVGTIGLVTKKIAHGNIGPQLTLLRCKNSIYYLYLKEIMSSYIIQKQVSSQNSGSAMNFFGIGETCKFKIFLPSLPEQLKIANFLTSLDQKINQSSSQIEKMELWKKGLLQKMFV